MSERPNVVLAIIVAAASLFAGLLGVGLVGLGGAGVVGLAAMVIGAFSACVYFLAELHRVQLAPLVLVALAVVSTAAFGRAALGYWRERRLLAALPLEPLEGGLAHAAGGIALYRTAAQRPAAFCFGLARPQVVVTEGLLALLNTEEQAAAVWHEVQHARVREPLKCLMARLAAQTFFWMPILADLLERYLLVKELEADRLATAKTSRQALAGALCGVLGQPTPVGAVGLADYAGARVDRLFDPCAPLPPITRPVRAALSVIGAIALALVLASPTHIDLGESAHLNSMLTSMSLHGLPGMAVGFAINGLILGCLTMIARRLLRSQRRSPASAA